MARSHATLALLLVVVVAAGCVGGSPQTTSTQPTETTSTPAETTTSTTYAGMGADGWYRSFTFRASEVSAAEMARDVAPEPTHGERPALAREAAANGTVTVRHVGADGPFDDGDSLRVNGTYYRVNATTVERETREAFRFDLSGPVASPASEYDVERAAAEATAVGNLSAADRRAFSECLPADGDVPDAGEGAFSAGCFVFYANDTAPASATLLDGDVHFVAYEGQYFAASLDERQRVERYTTRYAFSEVAPNASAFAASIRDDYVTNLSASNLTDRERRLLVDVVENGTIEWSGDRQNVTAAIHARERLLRDLPPRDLGRIAYVEIDGERYRLTLRKAVE